MSALFSDDFVQQVSRLRILARQVPIGGRHGGHRSRDLGSGMEFRDFRSYVPGDDLRRIDWNLYRRSGRLFLRLFEEPESLPVYILVDQSDSMFFEQPPRANTARVLAGALTAISLGQHDRVQVHPFGADLERPLNLTSGADGLRRVLTSIEALGPCGPTDLVTSLRRFSSKRLRGGLAVVISDFFDPSGIDAVTDTLRLLRHRLLLVQIVRRKDGEPSLEGELTLLDCETGAAVEVAVTPQTARRYRAAYQSFNDKIVRFAARRNAAHLVLDAERPVMAQLSSLFRNGVFVT